MKKMRLKMIGIVFASVVAAFMVMTIILDILTIIMRIRLIALVFSGFFWMKTKK